MRTMTMPGTMNPKQHDNHAGSAFVRVSTSPAPFSQLRYRPWRPYPGLF